MAVEFFGLSGSWQDVKRSARTTIHRSGSGLDPDASWKKSMLLAEHSPIRKIKFFWKWISIPYWVSVHFVRHWVGILHFVSTQRSDRIGGNRSKEPQDTPVDHECEANVQALISISRKRLCKQASPETRAAWQEIVDHVKETDPVIGSVLVPECIYRGFCPEDPSRSCGYVNTDAYRRALAEYRER